MKEIFLDTPFIIALASQTDQYHAKSVLLAEQLKTQSITLVTTRAVLLEIGNCLSKLKYRKASIALLDSLEQDPMIE